MLQHKGRSSRRCNGYLGYVFFITSYFRSFFYVIFPLLLYSWANRAKPDVTNTVHGSSYPSIHGGSFPTLSRHLKYCFSLQKRGASPVRAGDGLKEKENIVLPWNYRLLTTCSRVLETSKALQVQVANRGGSPQTPSSRERRCLHRFKAR